MSVDNEGAGDEPQRPRQASGAFATSQTASGKVAAPTIEPIEMCRVATTTTTNTTVSTARAHGRQAQERADEARHRLAALESEKYRIGVARHHGQGRERSSTGRPARVSRPASQTAT